MRLEWLDDLLAIVDHGGLARAAAARLLTQPAFSRRIRTIEEHVGAELLDRASRPVRLSAATLGQEARMRELASALRQLRRELSRQGDAFRNSVVIASQHALTTSLAPVLIRRHFPSSANYRLRSENREECYALVMTRQADIALAYQTPTDRFAVKDDFLEEQSLGSDLLIPVYAAAHRNEAKRWIEAGELPSVLYPAEVFLGRLMEREIRPRLPATLTLVNRAETALTPAALNLAVERIGVAWAPRSLARRDLAQGAICDLSDLLPSVAIEISAFRLRRDERGADVEDIVWDKLGGLRRGASIGGASRPAHGGHKKARAVGARLTMRE